MSKDWTVLSNWHSAPRGKSPPLTGVILMADGQEVRVDTQNECFYFLIDMPLNLLRFSGVFRNKEGYWLILQGETSWFWRKLTNLEYLIIQFWWQQLPERQVFEDELLSKVYAFLQRRQEDGSELMVTLGTKHRRLVMLTQHQCHAFYRRDWRIVDNPQIIAQLLADGRHFWIHRRNSFAKGMPMSRKTFLTYINPTAQRAS